jgi:hypothetical protein
VCSYVPLAQSVAGLDPESLFYFVALLLVALDVASDVLGRRQVSAWSWPAWMVRRLCMTVYVRLYEASVALVAQCPFPNHNLVSASVVNDSP